MMSLDHVRTLVDETVESGFRERDKDILISIVVADRRRRRRRCRQFHASNGPSLLSRTAKRVELIK